MNDNERLKKAVEGALTHDVRINLPQSDVRIACDTGTVTLSGTISSIAGKRLSGRLAGQVAGVKRVDDQLDVAVAHAMGDKEITQHIRHALLQERNIEEDQIDIQTDLDGHVILRGKVHSLIQYRLCEVLCWWVPGVRNVRNLLVINPPEEDNDAELKDNLMVILEKDPLVDPKHFQLVIREGKVILRGQANSPVEREAAENDCWFTPGVIDVDNQLTIA